MKLSRVAILALALPASLAAQQPQPNQQGGPMTTVFRNRTITFQRNLAQAFDSIPEAKFGYKPTPAQMTIGDIAQHLSNDNYFYCGNFSALKPPVSQEEATTPEPVKATWPKAKLVANLKASFKFCEDALAQLDDGKLDDMLTITSGGNSRQVVRVQPVLGHIVDLADHYSQIANYMRLNGMLPPTALPRPVR
jgi:uncharacterized damage-inducible protein DinB